MPIFLSCLPQVLDAYIKSFPDDALLFSVINEVDNSSSKLKNDLIQMKVWVCQWKMYFNPDRANGAQEVIVTRKNKTIIYPNVSSNNLSNIKPAFQFHLRLYLDARLLFKNRIIEKNGKVIKSVGLLCKWKYFLPRSSQLTI